MAFGEVVRVTARKIVLVKFPYQSAFSSSLNPRANATADFTNAPGVKSLSTATAPMRSTVRGLAASGRAPNPRLEMRAQSVLGEHPRLTRR
nr:hypothetical protein [uncultured bacterium]